MPHGFDPDVYATVLVVHDTLTIKGAGFHNLPKTDEPV